MEAHTYYSYLGMRCILLDRALQRIVAGSRIICSAVLCKSLLSPARLEIDYALRLINLLYTSGLSIGISYLLLLSYNYDQNQGHGSILMHWISTSMR